MKWFKAIFVLLFGAAVWLFVHQNMGVFTSPVTFSFTLPFMDKTEWNHSLFGLLFMAGVLGFFLGFMLLLKPWRRTRRALTEERKARSEEPKTPDRFTPFFGSAAKEPSAKEPGTSEAPAADNALPSENR